MDNQIADNKSFKKLSATTNDAIQERMMQSPGRS